MGGGVKTSIAGKMSRMAEEVRILGLGRAEALGLLVDNADALHSFLSPAMKHTP